jgi:hypothetical protein
MNTFQCLQGGRCTRCGQGGHEHHPASLQCRRWNWGNTVPCGMSGFYIYTANGLFWSQTSIFNLPPLITPLRQHTRTPTFIVYRAVFGWGLLCCV